MLNFVWGGEKRKRDIRVILYFVTNKKTPAQELHLPESPLPTATPVVLLVFTHSWSPGIVVPQFGYSKHSLVHSWLVKYSSIPVCIRFGSRAQSFLSTHPHPKNSNSWPSTGTLGLQFKVTSGIFTISSFISSGRKIRVTSFCSNSPSYSGWRTT